ncbi:phospho-N-acetylmuramoyl-pentapeptide transferase [Campylobacter iguaniorum]|uniref:Phospho-N-acetylmuramoyl-pentapeptide-transferase n=1 Tax=Campylobacter iguaniorum TaxID=1244531 RepID=A0A076FCR8_9BACT|nr:phospho-N-acetylmuramoyl-pentapeptide-transferase [Campylobacter iguaniorum]AII15192.1 phospho-N-acetylmuramoyl-pentapeptide transferase [Campylobacter iguaniorum]ALV25117.1 phospho-N-acetylmuramoyl-pentapeptide transferase [Campylobacter iguaniorum]ANE36319.1 phospho-N-acetylmuramoyl-pentapeptide transferase [Campylobacter iguaniorum]
MFYYLYGVFGINLFSYITVRAGVSFFLAFVLTVYLMPKFIAWAKSKNASQPIYELAPDSHKKKNKIPTMGGVIFVLSAIIATLLSAKLDNIFVIIGLLVLGGFCAIGFVDDIEKIIGKSNHAGLKARAKFALQWGLGFIVASLLFAFSELNTAFYLPFYKYAIFDMSYFGILFWALVLVSASNAVNLTDGLDGLATVPSIFALISLGTFAYLMGNAVYSSYLLLPKFVGVGELVILVSALIGALLGFLWFNCYPAEVFMGDSGSLSIGAFVGYMGIATKNELLLIIIGFVFVMETLSVILQVGSFKIRKKRIFLMAPIHHHFEIKGWNENKIIVRFWMIALLANLIALTALKLR